MHDFIEALPAVIAAMGVAAARVIAASRSGRTDDNDRPNKDTGDEN